MLKRLRARVLDRIADALAPRIAARIEEEIGARLRARTLRYIERERIGLCKGVAEERIARINQVFPPPAYRTRRDARHCPEAAE